MSHAIPNYLKKPLHLHNQYEWLSNRVSHTRRVPNFKQKKYFSEEETRWNRTMIHRNSACFMKQTIYGILSRVISCNRKDTKILLRIIPEAEYYCRNFVLLQYLQNFVLFQTFFHTSISLKYT
jgi:hypothetical protein